MKIKDFGFIEPGSSHRHGLQECFREVWPDSYSGFLEGLKYPKNTSTGESNGKTGNEMEAGLVKGLHRDPSKQIIPILSPSVCKCFPNFGLLGREFEK